MIHSNETIKYLKNRMNAFMEMSQKYKKEGDVAMTAFLLHDAELLDIIIGDLEKQNASE